MNELDVMSSRWPYLANIDNLDYQNMDLAFVDKVNKLGRQIQKILYINQGAASSGHSTRSLHYKRPAIAVDFYCIDMDLDDLFFFASKFTDEEGQGFGAVGAYPFWNRPGLHLDARKDNVYWYRDAEGKYHYSISKSEIERKLTKILERQKYEIDFCDADF